MLSKGLRNRIYNTKTHWQQPSLELLNFVLSKDRREWKKGMTPKVWYTAATDTGIPLTPDHWQQQRFGA